MDRNKRGMGAVDAAAIVGLADFAAPTLLALGARSMSAVPNRLTQTGTTNVPGPRVPLYLLGHQLRRVAPLRPRLRRGPGGDGDLLLPRPLQLRHHGGLRQLPRRRRHRRRHPGRVRRARGHAPRAPSTGRQAVTPRAASSARHGARRPSRCSSPSPGAACWSSGATDGDRRHSSRARRAGTATRSWSSPACWRRTPRPWSCDASCAGSATAPRGGAWASTPVPTEDVVRRLPDRLALCRPARPPGLRDRLEPRGHLRQGPRGPLARAGPSGHHARQALTPQRSGADARRRGLPAAVSAALRRATGRGPDASAAAQRARRPRSTRGWTASSPGGSAARTSASGARASRSRPRTSGSATTRRRSGSSRTGWPRTRCEWRPFAPPRDLRRAVRRRRAGLTVQPRRHGTRSGASPPGPVPVPSVRRRRLSGPGVTETGSPTRSGSSSSSIRRRLVERQVAGEHRVEPWAGRARRPSAR